MPFGTYMAFLSIVQDCTCLHYISEMFSALLAASNLVSLIGCWFSISVIWQAAWQPPQSPRLIVSGTTQTPAQYLSRRLADAFFPPSLPPKVSQTHCKNVRSFCIWNKQIRVPLSRSLPASLPPKRIREPSDQLGEKRTVTNTFISPSPVKEISRSDVWDIPGKNITLPNVKCV